MEGEFGLGVLGVEEGKGWSVWIREGGVWGWGMALRAVSS